jgi:hypothetical protein
LLFSKFSWIQPVYILNECKRTEVYSKKSESQRKHDSCNFHAFLNVST